MRTDLSSFPSTRTDFWHSQSITIARYTLASYLKSGWYWGEAVIVIGLAFALFKYPGDLGYFAGLANELLGFVAILGPAILVHRSMSARVYLPVSRLASRDSYIRGLMIAAGVLRIPLYLAFMAVALGLRAVMGATIVNMAIAALGGSVLTIVIATITVTLSNPIASRLVRSIFLLWLAMTLYASSSAPLAAFIDFLRIPIAPLAACFGFTLVGRIDLTGILGLVVCAIYMVGLMFLASYWFRKRDLILQ